MKFLQKSTQSTRKIIIIGLSGCILLVCAGRYQAISKQHRSEVPATTTQELLLPPTAEPVIDSSNSFIIRTMARWNEYLDQTSESFLQFIQWEEEARAEYIPSVLKYNLVSVFPEEDVDNAASLSIASILNNPAEFAETLLKPLYRKLDLPIRSKVSDSYGGQMYEVLNHKDAEWTASLYKWIQATPERAAAMRNLPASSVTGGYNPQNPLHKKEDPSTWLIPSWKNVTVDFYNGDDQRIELYSNTQEILSLASVNTFGTDWQDASAFKTYINQLWESSHSYNTTISDLYYCDGCETLTPVAVNTSESAVNGVPDPQADISSGSPTEGVEMAPVASNSTATPASTETMASAVVESESNHQDVSVNAVAAAETDASIAQVQPQAGPASSTAATSESQSQELSTEDFSLAINSDLQTTESLLYSPEIHLNAEGKFCSGHVDLTIHAKIIGLSEKNNLFTVDKAAPKTWSTYTKAYVYELFSQDWNEEYGLSSMNLGIGKPLTSSEIADYMSLLAPETSTERRAVIAYALNSVGKIPYYYGGKPTATGYENNHFSSPRKPDQKGRILSGLDCSGWVNWVYWSAVEERLTSLGTSGLIHEGRGINKSDLKPGDILVKPGLESHVVMFLAWAPDGSVICIHETGGTTNNVVVSTLNLNWPYYRAILD